METALRIVAALSLVAFIVGMFNPKTVKCSSRGKVVLIFIGIFLVSGLIGASLLEETNPVTNEEVIDSATHKGTRKAQRNSHTWKRLCVHNGLCKQRRANHFCRY